MYIWCLELNYSDIITTKQKQILLFVDTCVRSYRLRIICKIIYASFHINLNTSNKIITNGDVIVKLPSKCSI